MHYNTVFKIVVQDDGNYYTYLYDVVAAITFINYIERHTATLLKLYTVSYFVYV